jgi:hypothetical protein
MQKHVEREVDEAAIPEPRKALVTQISAEIRADKKHWEKPFKRMREDQNFAFGFQWNQDPNDDRYVANLVLRHIQQRVAALYAKNPKAVAQRRKRLEAVVWDGSMEQVMQSVQTLQMATQAGQMGMMPAPGQAEEAQKAMQILQDAQAATERKEMIDKFAKTLELLYDYNLDEQNHPFKVMMKLTVRRAITTAVAYVKLGFQRVLEPRPDIEAQIADSTQQLATMERLSAKLGDGYIDNPETSPDTEQLRLSLQAVQGQKDMVVREGLVLDYPLSTSIIPHRRCQSLREFVGCEWVTQEYYLTPDEVEEIYGVCVTSAYKHYRKSDTSGADAVYEEVSATLRGDRSDDPDDCALCLVWEQYNRKTGLVYVLCEGYPDFLREPAKPETAIERFYPWFALVLNEADHPTEVYPPSDARLMRAQQKEYNRLREGLREHRIANRPLTYAAAGTLSDDDKETLQNRPANAVVEIDGLQPGQKVEDVLQAAKPPGVDPNLYEVNSAFEDIFRVVGGQEATLGGTSGSTATEAGIAESSTSLAMQSSVDDLDGMLTQLARAAGQILMAEVSEDIVKQVIGPGAVWPEMSREDIAKEVFLEIEAGSTGRPNQAQEIQNFERLAPLLFQIPGISPKKMAQEGLKRLDDRLEIEDVYDQNLPSITAMGAQAGAPPGGATQNSGPNAPASQGAQGGNNSPQPTPPEGNPGGANSASINPVGPPPGMM